jgi:hypothetical protein
MPRACQDLQWPDIFVPACETILIDDRIAMMFPRYESNVL